MTENTEKSCPQVRQCKSRGAGFYTFQILFTTFLQVRQFTGGGFRVISMTERVGGTGEWRKMQSEQLTNFQSPPSVIRVNKKKE
jgi:hypothetical protein